MDEAKAAAREEAEEQRIQATDAERRIQILRGQQIEPRPADKKKEDEPKRDRRDGSGKQRKRRRIAGEDDTDREMRFAREDREMLPAKAEMQMTGKKNSDAPLIDSQGHINLFPSEVRSHKETKNAEVEAEKARKKKECADQYMMRFSNAAGFEKTIDQKPWYENAVTGKGFREAVDVPSKDVWGNEDPRRKEREKMRMAAGDPLVAMRNGAAGVREAERQRTKWTEDKAQQIKEIEEDERQKVKRRRRRRQHHEEDGLRKSSPDNLHKSENRHCHHSKDVERAPRHSHWHRSKSRDKGRQASIVLTRP